MRDLTGAVIVALHALHLMLRKRKPVAHGEIRRSSGFAMDRIRTALWKLERNGVVKRVPRRGYVLAKAPGEIALLDVVRIIDEPRPPTAPCGGDYDACASRASCILAPVCRNADQGYQEALRSFTLAELTDVPPALPNCLDPRVKAEAS